MEAASALYKVAFNSRWMKFVTININNFHYWESLKSIKKLKMHAKIKMNPLKQPNNNFHLNNKNLNLLKQGNNTESQD